MELDLSILVTIPPLAAVSDAGIVVNTFAIGRGATSCGGSSEIQEIADSTGGVCRNVVDPSTLAAEIVAPAGLQNVSVSVNGNMPLTATLDSFGNWSATVPATQTLHGANSIVATATADDASMTQTSTSQSIPGYCRTEIAVDDVTVGEGDGSAEFTLLLANPYTKDVTVDVATAYGTALSADFTPLLTETVKITAGKTSVTVTVAITDDGLVESAETFTLNLTNATNATIADATGVATIQDNDTLPTISVDDVSVGEGDGSAEFTLSLSNPYVEDVTVDVATAVGTASAADFTALPTQTVTILASQSSVTVTVAITDDGLVELPETFTLNLTNASNATIADATGEGEIQDNDTLPMISVNDVSVGEGAGSAEFTLTLSNPYVQDVTVDVATAVGTASAADFTALPSTQVTIMANQTTVTVTVDITDDGLVESAETFTLNLTNATNATILDASGEGEIQDNDTLPMISVGDVSVGEGDGSAEFTLSLSNPYVQDVTVDVATAVGTASAADFTALTSTQVTIMANQTTVTVTVDITDDGLVESAEHSR